MTEGDKNFFTVIIVLIIILCMIVAGITLWIGLNLNLTSSTTNQPLAAIEDTTEAELINPTEKVEEEQLSNILTSSEFAASAIMLQAYGVEVDEKDLANAAKYSNDDFVYFYWGELDSGAIFPPGLVIANNLYLQNIDSDYRTFNLSGESWEDIKAIVSQGNPVVVYYTDTNSYPVFTGWEQEGYSFYENEQCVCIYKIDEQGVHIKNPLTAQDEIITEEWFVMCWNACGSMAIGATNEI